MHILFVTQWFDPEPGAIRGLPLARWLRQRGHELSIVTGFPNYPSGRLYPGYRMRWRQWESREGVSILRVPLFPSHDQSTVRRILNYLSFAISAGILGPALISRPDVVYLYHPPATIGLPGLVLKATRRVPFVYHIADMWPESVVESGMVGHGRLKEFTSELLSRWCSAVYGQAAAITVLSPGFKRMLVERGVLSEKIHIVYNWVEEDVFRPVPRDANLEAALGFQGRFNVVYAGNLGAFQGLENVIRAALRLRHAPAIQIVLVGTGQREAQLKSLARQLGADNVVFLDQRSPSEVAKINSLADVLLVHLKDLPFFASTIPGKTQVALACGRPILMAVRGDAADIVHRAQAGLTCEPENDEAVAQAILEFYRMNREEREAMGRRGREFYLREMSLADAGKRMEALLQQSCAPAARIQR